MPVEHLYLAAAACPFTAAQADQFHAQLTGAVPQGGLTAALTPSSYWLEINLEASHYPFSPGEVWPEVLTHHNGLLRSPFNIA
jgi:hypothetical protein